MSKFKILNIKSYGFDIVLNFGFLRLDFKKHGSGFTLLETVIALGVILGGIIGPYTLATRGVIASGSSKEKLTALNLAQEGIELVRHLRDNNIIAGQSPWTKGISPAQGSDGQQCQDVGWQIGVVQEDGSSLGELSCYREQPLYYYRHIPLYNNTAQLGGVLGEASVYKRRIYIKHPLEASDLNSFRGVPASEQMLIRSTVEWQHRSVTQSVTLEEVMFDWE